LRRRRATEISLAPSAARARAASADAPRSTTTRSARPSAALISCTTARPRSASRPLTTTCAPSAATNTSKSQLFHYFPEGRSQLLVAVAQHEADLVLADQQPHLDDLTSWESWRDLVVERYRQQGLRCPLSVLVSQLGPTEPAIRAAVVDLLDRWQERIAAGIRGMQARGKVASRLDAERTAAALLAGIQGGVVVMLATGQITHLEAALDQAIERLRDSTT
jgi:hypothetical protein